MEEEHHIPGKTERTLTEVVNLHHLKEGWIDEKDTTYIGRGSIRRELDGTFGNPFEGYGRMENIQRFKTWFLKRLAHDDIFKKKVLALSGRRLVCFCKPLPCHGDVILGYIETQALDDEIFRD